MFMFNTCDYDVSSISTSVKGIKFYTANKQV